MPGRRAVSGEPSGRGGEEARVVELTGAGFELLREAARSSGATVRVAGVCMLPALPEGALVRVRAARIYWPGDVVAFAAEDGRMLVHRVIGYRRWRGRWCLVTRADDSRSWDAPVCPELVVGRVTSAVEPQLDGGVTLAWRARAVGRFAGMLVAGALRRLGSSPRSR